MGKATYLYVVGSEWNTTTLGKGEYATKRLSYIDGELVSIRNDKAITSWAIAEHNVDTLNDILRRNNKLES